MTWDIRYLLGDKRMALTINEKEKIEQYVKEPKWRVMNKRADFMSIGEKFGIDPVVARVITNRDIVGDEAIDMYLRGDVTKMHDPSLMKDLPEGCKIIYNKLFYFYIWQYSTPIQTLSAYITYLYSV